MTEITFVPVFRWLSPTVDIVFQYLLPSVSLSCFILSMDPKESSSLTRKNELEMWPTHVIFRALTTGGSSYFWMLLTRYSVNVGKS